MFGFKRNLIGKKAPDISGDAWFNQTALPGPARSRLQQDGTINVTSDLKEYVTLIEIWDYSCKNCIDTLDPLRHLWDTYKDQKLLIIGVHTPEFGFGADPEKVEDAIIRFNLNYPVISDPEYDTWKRYRNKAWPRIVIADKKGKIRYDQTGDGHYDAIEAAIKKLLAK